VRFGVIAPTSMVARMAVIPAIATSSSCELAAMASLSQPAGSSRQRSEGEVRRYGSYDELLLDPAVEAVYIPLPNSMHREWTERSAVAGKHVLCEKPLAATPEDADAMASACADAAVVLMEAYMTPFHPRSRAVLAMARSGRLGTLTRAKAVFTGRLSRPDDHRWRPEMGGGALLDVGIYCLAPVLAAAGVTGDAADNIDVVVATAARAPLGVDASFRGTLRLGDEWSADFECSFVDEERQHLELVGSELALEVERAFTPSWDDTSIELQGRDGSIEVVTTADGDPYLGMVEHFCDVVRGRAKLERTPAESVALARLVARLDAASRS
jgi:D-xylose 1-dehydrogenase (NADP+, D-xylono-1,5-lactone-forming)